jgi:UDP-glucose 4-epimerase
MSNEEFADLRVGETIQNLGSGEGYQVVAVIHNRCIVVTKTILATNPTEWKQITETFTTHSELL